MLVEPIRHTRWDDERGEMIDTGVVIGYQALSTSGTVLGRGETVADAIEEALRATWLPPDRKPHVA